MRYLYLTTSKFFLNDFENYTDINKLSLKFIENEIRKSIGRNEPVRVVYFPTLKDKRLEEKILNFIILNLSVDKLVLISSGRVYGNVSNATEKDKVDASDEENKNILNLEKLVKDNFKKFNILRISTPLYSKAFPGFISYIKRFESPNKQIVVPKDIFLCPLHLDDLHLACIKLVDSKDHNKEIFNLSGPDYVNYLDWAEMLGQKDITLVPITSLDLEVLGMKLPNTTSNILSCYKFFKYFKFGRKRIGLIQGSTEVIETMEERFKILRERDENKKIKILRKARSGIL